MGNNGYEQEVLLNIFDTFDIFKTGPFGMSLKNPLSFLLFSVDLLTL